MRRVAMIGAGMTDFGELFQLGIKDMIPMAVSEAVGSVDKGFDRDDIQAAWDYYREHTAEIDEDIRENEEE